MTDGLQPTVLIVEDESLIAMMVEDILVDAGYRVQWAADGPRALSLAQSTPALAATVVNLDLGQGMDGREVLQRLREANPTMPAVFVSGFDFDAPQADLRGLGGPTSRLKKPFEPGELLAMLADVLGRPIGQYEPGRRRRRSDAVPQSPQDQGHAPTEGDRQAAGTTLDGWQHDGGTPRIAFVTEALLKPRT